MLCLPKSDHTTSLWAQHSMSTKKLSPSLHDYLMSDAEPTYLSELTCDDNR